MITEWKRCRSQLGWVIWYCTVVSGNQPTDLYTITSTEHVPDDNQTIYTNFKSIFRVFELVCDDRIKEYAEDGKVAYIESGRDCDCVEYDGRVHIVDATLDAYKALDEEIDEYADGPYHLDLCRVSKTLGVKYEPRPRDGGLRERQPPQRCVEVPVTDRIQSYWGDMTVTAKKSDRSYMHLMRDDVRKLMVRNQELCCTPLRQAIDEMLCGIYNDLCSHLENLK